MSLNTLITALEVGFICSLAVLSIYVSYSMLNVCDLSLDGCFTLGAAVGALVALKGYPYLSLICAVISGCLSGFVCAFLQTRMGINSLLSGIIVNTALYSVNMAVMGGSSLLNLNKTETIFVKMKRLLEGSSLYKFSAVFTALIVLIIVIIVLYFFFKTKLGLAIRATGNNPKMVEASSINPVFTITTGLIIASGISALSGSLMAQYQKSVSIDIGTGMLTISLASLLIGRTLIRKNSSLLKEIACVFGALIFRITYMLALRLRMPVYMLKLVSSLIVVLAIYLPYLNSKKDDFKRRRMKDAGAD